MKEKNIVLILCLILLIIAIGINYLNFFYSEFNFYKSELSINGTSIKEKIYFKPNTDYHTLYRNFYDFLISEGVLLPNSVIIKNVACSSGAPYAYLKFRDCLSFSGESYNKTACLPYTEQNEYGCGFGYERGFKKGQEQWIEAEFELNPEMIFVIKGKSYVKFVAYSQSRHMFLNINKNLAIRGDAVYANYYFTKENAVVYIPYSGDTTGKILVSQSNFQFDTNYFYYILFFIFSLFPCVILYFSWRIGGKEINESDVLNYITNYPKKRNGWEVAAFFTTFFGQLSNNLISSILLGLYHKKIIDINVKKGFFGDDCYIKILKEDKNLDWMEKELLDIIKFVLDSAKEDDFKDGYLNYGKASKRFGLRYSLPKKFRELQAKLSKETRNYISYAGAIAYALFSVGLAGLSALLIKSAVLPIFFILAFMVVFIVSIKTNLLSKFKKEEFYIEYKQWKGFKNYLNGSESIRKQGHKATILWDEYMIYAAALGVSKKALKELRDLGVISENQYHIYVTTHTFSTSIAQSGKTAGSSGGHGGAGGGGIGGGGGGGR